MAGLPGGQAQGAGSGAGGSNVSCWQVRNRQEELTLQPGTGTCPASPAESLLLARALHFATSRRGTCSQAWEQLLPGSLAQFPACQLGRQAAGGTGAAPLVYQAEPCSGGGVRTSSQTLIVSFPGLCVEQEAHSAAGEDQGQDRDPSATQGPQNVPDLPGQAALVPTEEGVLGRGEDKLRQERH